MEINDEQFNRLLLTLIEIQAKENSHVSSDVAKHRAGMKRYLRRDVGRELKPNRRLVIAGSLVIHLGELDREKPHLGYEKSGCWIWVSDFRREVCPFCSNVDCCYHCDGSTAKMNDSSGVPNRPLETEDEVASRLKVNGALDGIESLVLACAVAGIDVESNAFGEALQTAVDGVGNNLA